VRCAANLLVVGVNDNNGDSAKNECSLRYRPPIASPDREPQLYGPLLRCARGTVAGILLLGGTALGLAHSLAAGTVCYALFLLVGQLSGPAIIRVLYASLSRDQRTAGNAAIGTVSGISTWP
jgi:hypothetical protein